MVYNGTHADKALIAQTVPVHTTLGCLLPTDLIIVNILKMMSTSPRRPCAKTPVTKIYKNQVNHLKIKITKTFTFNFSRKEKKTVIFSCIEFETWGLGGPILSYMALWSNLQVSPTNSILLMLTIHHIVKLSLYNQLFRLK